MLSDFGFSRARVFLLTVFRRLSCRLADDRGAAALVLAAIIAIIAFTALSIFLNRFVGDREFARVQAGAAGQSNIQPALMVYFLKQTSANTLPCPDTSTIPDGIADSCNSSGTTTGVVPWITLGLSKDDVVDAYGNFFTYVVSGVAKSICGSVTTDLAGSTATTTYTGQLIDATDLVLEDSSSATRDVAYALISHGKNRLGGVTSNGGAYRGTYGQQGGCQCLLGAVHDLFRAVFHR